ncbi:MAG: Pentapeptide repeat protein [Magnetococcales bacterium]|nr:Pentapeptide repeat protein [Magnetococcales bacterium]
MASEEEDVLTGEKRELRVIFLPVHNQKNLTTLLDADPPTRGWLFLGQSDQDEAVVKKLAKKSKIRQRSVRFRVAQEFVLGLIGVEKIISRYKKLKQRHEKAEGVGYFYLDPIAINEERRESVQLTPWIENFVQNERGVVHLVAEYGEGKTTFCYEMAFSWLKQWEEGQRDQGIPLLFFLNECRAGSLEVFITHRLMVDYGIALSLDGFRNLCLDGTFIPYLDAFDQMGQSSNPQAVIQDSHLLSSFSQQQGVVVATCRQGYYDKFLKSLRNNRSREDDNFVSSVLFLKGFENNQIKEALRNHDALLAIVTQPDNQLLLNSVLRKPLTLRVMAQHAETFLRLWTTNKKNNQPIREYDLFDLLFKEWLQGTMEGFLDQQQAIGACRNIVRYASVEGMNVGNLFIPWANSFIGECAARSERDHDEMVEAIRKDFTRLPLLDTSALEEVNPLILFRFNVFLEFLTAKFVINELCEGAADSSFLKSRPLTRETRDLVVEKLDSELHGPVLKKMIDGCQYKHAKDVEYLGGNSLTLILDLVRLPDLPATEREQWKGLLDSLPLDRNILRCVDARTADLTGFDFSASDLRDSDFSFAVLQNVNFAKANLENVLFNEVGGLLTAAFIGDREACDPCWHLAGGTENGIVMVWESHRPRYPRRETPHRQAITALDLAKQANRIHSISRDGSVAEIDVAVPNTIQRYPLGMGSLHTMAISADEQWQAVAGDRPVVMVRKLGRAQWNSIKLNSSAENSQPQPRGMVAHPMITALTFTPDGHNLLAGNKDGEIFRISDWKQNSDVSPWISPLPGAISQLIALAGGMLLAILDGHRPHFINNHGVAVANHRFIDHAMTKACYATKSKEIFWLENKRVMVMAEGSERPRVWLEITEKTDPEILVCSADGRFVAVGGEYLIVWHLGSSGPDEVLRETVRMNCKGLILLDNAGLSPEKKDWFKNRGALA